MTQNTVEKKDEPKLTRFILANFKAFGRRQHIPIRPITLIYGRNNSGKSSLLHALLYARSLRGGPTSSVLQGGWPRLIHGRKETSIMEIGWEWENAQSASNLRQGKIINRFSQLPMNQDSLYLEQTLFAELNGRQLFDFEDSNDMNLFPETDSENIDCLTALKHVQEWMAQELEVMENDFNTDIAIKESLPQIRLALEDGAYSDVIVANLKSHQQGLFLGRDGDVLPPDFSYMRNLDANTKWQYSGLISGLHKNWREVSNLFQENGNGDTLGLFGFDPVAHVKGFVIERCAYLYFRWLQSVWKNYTRPIAGLLDNLKYLPAIRERPDEVLLREPNPSLENKNRNTPFKGLPEWISQRSAIEKVEKWLKEHKQLAGDIKLDFDELSSNSRRKGRESKPSLGPVRLSLFDTVRKISLRFDEVGFGLSQFIPILLACYAEQDGSEPATGTLLIEEPEAHVHPAMQCELADVFIEVTTREDHPLRNIICETHSEYLLLRLKRRILEGLIKPEHVAILYVENMGAESIVQEMPINEKGELIRDWPGGFFEDGLRELLE